jgi:hypothetical protein
MRDLLRDGASLSFMALCFHSAAARIASLFEAGQKFNCPQWRAWRYADRGPLAFFATASYMDATSNIVRRASRSFMLSALARVSAAFPS